MNLATTPTLTRFRVQTASPLEPIKAWHIVSSESGLSCIGDLARDVAFALGIESEVILELDGFVLLSTSPVGAVRDGDVITVKCKPQTDKRKAPEATSSNLQKRQKTESPAPASSIAPIVAGATVQPSIATASSVVMRHPSAKTTAPDPSSSSEATSSDSDSDSDTTSDDSSDDSGSSSESSSDSDSESESESDSEGAPTPQPISRQPRPTSVPLSTKTPTSLTTPRPTPSQPPVPPGQGKQSTKNRNARRRLMRKHQAAGTGLTPTPQPRDTPLCQSPPVLPSTTTINKPPAPIAPAKNANKNKRKGFDKDMAEAVATRTVFGSDTAAKPKSQYTHYHVVPPSERTDLPSNVIVTSVDVETMDGMDGVGEWFDGETREDVDETRADEPTKVEEPPAENASKIDWEVVDSDWEKRWDSFKVVGSDGWKTLKVGGLLAWQALTIDPITCTPCTKIHLARVTTDVDPSSTKVECFIIDRPGADGVAFGYGGTYEDEEMEDGTSEETGETRSVEVGELESWKVVG